MNGLSITGMGRSIRALLDSLGLEPEFTVGHSAGAALLIRMSLDRQIAPEAIVSLNGALQPFGGAVGQFFAPIARMFATLPLMTTMFAWRARDPRVIDGILKQTGSRLDADGVALYRRLAGDAGHVGAALGMMANWDLHTLERDLPRLQTRLVLVAALRDEMIRPSVATHARRLLPAAEIVRLPGLGHLAHEERPDLVAALIEDVAAGRPLRTESSAAARKGAAGVFRPCQQALRHDRPSPLPARTRAPQAACRRDRLGFGGLAMAIRLAAKGYQVTVFERCEQAGGRASVFRQDGFTFDAGPTIITAPHLLEELWTLCGRKLADDVPLIAMNPFYELRFNDGSRMSCSGDAESMRAEIRRLSPGDVEGYERFLEWSREVFEIGFDKLGNQPFQTPWSMAKATPEIISLGGLRSIHAMASRFVRDERIRIALSFHPLFIGGNPLKATAIYGLVAHLERHWGVHFAKGGTGALIKGMVRLLEDLGGRIHYNTTVDRITAEGRRATGVRLSTGQEVPAHVVACNADSIWAYENLLPASARDPLTSLRLKHASFSCGLFVWYFGTRRRFEEVPHHSIILGPRYAGLLDDIFRRKHLAKDFSLYLHRPTATDPSLAPEGCDTFYALSPVPHLASGTDWGAMAEPYRKAVEARLMETVLPGLSDEIVTSRMMTPLDFEHALSLAPRGRLRNGADPDAIRLSPPAEQVALARQPVHGGCRRPSWRGRAGRADLGAHRRRARAGSARSSRDGGLCVSQHLDPQRPRRLPAVAAAGVEVVLCGLAAAAPSRA